MEYSLTYTLNDIEAPGFVLILILMEYSLT